MVLLHGHLLKLKDLIIINHLRNTFSYLISSNIQKAINEQNHSTTKMIQTSHEISTFLKFGIVKLLGNLCSASLKSLWSEYVAWQQMEVFTLWRGHFHQNAMYNTILVGNIGNCLNYVWRRLRWAVFSCFIPLERFQAGRYLHPISIQTEVLPQRSCFLYCLLCSDTSWLWLG